MTEVYSPQEIVRIAIHVEKNGAELYAHLEKKATDKPLKEVWRYLKDQEGIHQRAFQEMLQNCGDYFVYEFCPGEYEEYLRAISANYIFTERMVSQKKKQVLTDVEAIDFGLTIEKDSILTYTVLQQYVVAGKQAVVQNIINEEKQHFVRLTLLKERIALEHSL